MFFIGRTGKLHFLHKLPYSGIYSSKMKYLSTRGANERLTFSEVVLAGLARDGGLYIPESYPQCSEFFPQWQSLNYSQLALEVIQLYVGEDISKETLKTLIDKSYASFDNKEVTPMTLFSGGEILELYHGPTFAFKDIALQFLGNLFEHLLVESGQHLNIVGATSGDTGSAAIYGIRGKKGINIFMLHPKGKVSPVQEMQMTTVLDENVFNLSIEGTFDDCQNIVKSLFGDLDYRDSHHLGAVNSINWARILAQTVYYFYAGLRFKQQYPDKPLVFSVPTGNFGDVFAGYVAKQMGLPIEKLIIGTNENDIIARVINNGHYRLSEVSATHSPAMDIQISSNFERVLFDICERNSATVNRYMKALKQQGLFQLSEHEVQKLQSLFVASKVTNEETIATMARLYQQQRVIDPHTAVGIGAAEKSDYDKVICLSTAHPAKFPDVVKQATGQQPAAPEAILALEDLPRKSHGLPNNTKAVAEYIIRVKPG